MLLPSSSLCSQIWLTKLLTRTEDPNSEWINQTQMCTEQGSPEAILLIHTPSGPLCGLSSTGMSLYLSLQEPQAHTLYG